MSKSRLWRECVGEMVGTFILVFFGLGAVRAAAISGALNGLWQVAIVFGVATALAIYCVGAVSGCHINPAMTIAFTAFRGFPIRKVVPYVLAQLAGAFLAAALLHGMYGNVIARFEQSHNIVRGQAGSERTAMVYGCYYPLPDGRDAAPENVSLAQAMLAEGLGTAMLAFLVFALTDGHNLGRPNGTFFAVLIGLAVAVIVSIIAPLTESALNPARDFGPRLFSYFAGWGRIAIPGPRGFLAVYVLSPILGALAGSVGYEFVLHPAMRTMAKPERAEEQEDAQ